MEATPFVGGLLYVVACDSSNLVTNGWTLFVTLPEMRLAVNNLIAFVRRSCCTMVAVNEVVKF